MLIFHRERRFNRTLIYSMLWSWRNIIQWTPLSKDIFSSIFTVLVSLFFHLLFSAYAQMVVKKRNTNSLMTSIYFFVHNGFLNHVGLLNSDRWPDWTVIWTICQIVHFLTRRYGQNLVRPARLKQIDLMGLIIYEI